jgi:hypothetical protein
MYDCRACGKRFAWNTTRMNQRLNSECLNRDRQSAVSNVRQRIDISRLSNGKILKQNSLIILRLITAQKQQLDLLTANVCYTVGLPLSLYESSELKAFLHLLNSAYKLLSRKIISGLLLTDVYSQTKSHVEHILTSLKRINVVTDESININDNRIINLFIKTGISSFH